jgi:hypothetical protein
VTVVPRLARSSKDLKEFAAFRLSVLLPSFFILNHFGLVGEIETESHGSDYQPTVKPPDDNQGREFLNPTHAFFISSLVACNK